MRVKLYQTYSNKHKKQRILNRYLNIALPTKPLLIQIKHFFGHILHYFESVYLHVTIIQFETIYFLFEPSFTLCYLWYYLLQSGRFSIFGSHRTARFEIP